MKRVALVAFPLFAVIGCFVHQAWQFANRMSNPEVVVFRTASPNGELTATLFVLPGWAGDAPSTVVNIQHAAEPFDDWGGKRIFHAEYLPITDARWLSDDSVQVTWGGAYTGESELIRREAEAVVGRKIDCVFEHRDNFDVRVLDRFDSYEDRYRGEVMVRESGTKSGSATAVFMAHESKRLGWYFHPMVFMVDGSHTLEVTPLEGQRIRIECATCEPDNVIVQKEMWGTIAIEYGPG